MNITDISGIGDVTAQRLKTHGIDSVEAVAQAFIEQLAAVPGIGANRAAALRESARRLLPDTAAEARSSETVPAPAGDGAEMERRKDGKGKKGKKGKKEKKGKKGKEQEKEGKKEKKQRKKKEKDKERRKKKKRK